MDQSTLTDTIKSYLSQLTDIPIERIDVDAPLEHYGLDSIGAAGLSGHLSEKLDIELSADMAYEHPTIASMTRHIAELMHGPVPLPHGA